MPTQILMPALSPTMEEGTLAKWLVKEGDPVAPGDVIAEIETDKATMEVEAVDEGTLGKILVQEGTEGVKVNTPIAVLIAEGEDANDAAEAASSSQGPAAPAPRDEPVHEPRSDDGANASASKGKDGMPQAPQAAAKAATDARPERPKAARPAADPEIPDGTETVTITMREALRDAMAEEMRRDERVFVMGEEVAEYQGAYKVTQGLLDEFGDRRVIDTPITEHGFAGVGIGAAFAGLRPVVEFMTWNFAMQAMDQLINSAAKTNYMSGGQMRCPIVFRGPNGAAARVAAQHSQCFSAWYAHVPGLIVIAPSNAVDAKGLLKSAIRDPNPVMFLENEILYGQSAQVPKLDDWLVPIGKAKVVREGADVTVVSFARGMTYALDAADTLAEEGIEAEVIDLRTLRPLDLETVIESVKKTNRLVTVEEAWPVASIGATICARVTAEAFDYLDAPPMQISGEDVPMPYAANLEKLALPDPARVVKAAKAVCYVT